MINSYRDLIVWQRAMELVEEVYRLAGRLPKDELYGLSDQIRRAAVSIPSNVAEGYARKAAKDYGRFLVIARGSKYELETQLEICLRVGYLDKKDAEKALQLCEEVGKMLNSIMAKL